MDVLLGKGDGTFRNGGSRLINAYGNGTFESLVAGDFTGVAVVSFGAPVPSVSISFQ